ncbi:uncharacterized protein [Antedon mediterranea]|uniref:uncharacterized protein n=1 Tax=Antedon mediterranea TaxID=105859 RepID=UPI003AF8D678
METRNSCRYCRFQKCMALGMCKEGIKLGRRPKTDGDLHLTNHFSKIDVPPNAINVPRWHSWPTFPTICQPPIKQESIYPSDMHQCYGSQYPIKNQHCSYPKQKLHSVPNDLIDPSYDFGGEPYLLGHNMQSSFTPAYHQSSQHISYNHTMYQQSSPQEQLSPSLSMTLPEVHSGAYTAMAYANMYRGQHTNEFFFDASTNVKTESKDDLELTELKPLEKKNQIVSETGIVSFSTAMSYDTCQQFKENQKHNPQINSQELPIENALKRRLPDENGNNNSKLQKTNVLVSKNFVIVYEHLEKLVVDEWTSSLKSSDNMSEVLNPQKSSMPKVKACFKKFAETISGFQDLANESKDELIRQALCPVLGIIITHYFTNKTQGAHPVLSHESVGCGEEIQRLGSLEMAVLCGICLTQTEKTEAQKPLDMKKTEQFLQTSLEDVFNADKYHILLDIASKVCHQTSTNK